MKKGQIEMSITVLVLAVFFVLLFIGLIFYFSFSFESFKESQSKILGERYNVYLSYVINLPELKCSYMGVEKECLDASKMKQLRDPYYQRIFSGVPKIYVNDITNNNVYFVSVFRMIIENSNKMINLDFEIDAEFRRYPKRKLQCKLVNSALFSNIGMIRQYQDIIGDLNVTLKNLEEIYIRDFQF